MQERDNLDAQYDLQLYAASCNAWFATRLERDKSLLTLSSAGIGILITLASTVGPKSAEMLILFILSLTSFIACVSLTLLIFKRNSTYITKKLIEQEKSKDSLLENLDRAAVITFSAGLALACVIGFSTAINSFIERSDEMSQNQKFKDRTGIESFEGADALRKKKTNDSTEKKVNNANSKEKPQKPEDNQSN